jgi:hypothetical protein
MKAANLIAKIPSMVCQRAQRQCRPRAPEIFARSVYTCARMGFGFWVSGVGFGLGLGFQDLGFRVKGLNFSI